MDVLSSSAVTTFASLLAFNEQIVLLNAVNARNAPPEAQELVVSRAAWLHASDGLGGPFARGPLTLATAPNLDTDLFNSRFTAPAYEAEPDEDEEEDAPAVERTAATPAGAPPRASPGSDARWFGTPIGFRPPPHDEVPAPFQLIAANPNYDVHDVDSVPNVTETIEQLLAISLTPANRFCYPNAEKLVTTTGTPELAQAAIDSAWNTLRDGNKNYCTLCGRFHPADKHLGRLYTVNTRGTKASLINAIKDALGVPPPTPLMLWSFDHKLVPYSVVTGQGYDWTRYTLDDFFQLREDGTHVCPRCPGFDSVVRRKVNFSSFLDAVEHTEFAEPNIAIPRDSQFFHLYYVHNSDVVLYLLEDLVPFRLPGYYLPEPDNAPLRLSFLVQLLTGDAAYNKNGTHKGLTNNNIDDEARFLSVSRAFFDKWHARCDELKRRWSESTDYQAPYNVPRGVLEFSTRKRASWNTPAELLKGKYKKRTHEQSGSSGAAPSPQRPRTSGTFPPASSGDMPPPRALPQLGSLGSAHSSQQDDFEDHPWPFIMPVLKCKQVLTLGHQMHAAMAQTRTSTVSAPLIPVMDSPRGSRTLLETLITHKLMASGTVFGDVFQIDVVRRTDDNIGVFTTSLVHAEGHLLVPALAALTERGVLPWSAPNAAPLDDSFTRAAILKKNVPIILRTVEAVIYSNMSPKWSVNDVTITKDLKVHIPAVLAPMADPTPLYASPTNVGIHNLFVLAKYIAYPGAEPPAHRDPITSTVVNMLATIWLDAKEFPPENRHGSLEKFYTTVNNYGFSLNTTRAREKHPVELDFSHQPNSDVFTLHNSTSKSAADASTAHSIGRLDVLHDEAAAARKVRRATADAAARAAEEASAYADLLVARAAEDAASAQRAAFPGGPGAEGAQGDILSLALRGAGVPGLPSPSAVSTEANVFVHSRCEAGPGGSALGTFVACNPTQLLTWAKTARGDGSKKPRRRQSRKRVGRVRVQDRPFILRSASAMAKIFPSTQGLIYAPVVEEMKFTPLSLYNEMLDTWAYVSSNTTERGTAAVKGHVSRWAAKWKSLRGITSTSCVILKLQSVCRSPRAVPSLTPTRDLADFEVSMMHRTREGARPHVVHFPNGTRNRSSFSIYIADKSQDLGCEVYMTSYSQFHRWSDTMGIRIDTWSNVSVPRNLVAIYAQLMSPPDSAHLLHVYAVMLPDSYSGYKNKVVSITSPMDVPITSASLTIQTENVPLFFMSMIRAVACLMSADVHLYMIHPNNIWERHKLMQMDRGSPSQPAAKIFLEACEVTYVLDHVTQYLEQFCVIHSAALAVNPHGLHAPPEIHARESTRYMRPEDVTKEMTIFALGQILTLVLRCGSMFVHQDSVTQFLLGMTAEDPRDRPTIDQVIGYFCVAPEPEVDPRPPPLANSEMLPANVSIIKKHYESSSALVRLPPDSRLAERFQTHAL